MVAHSSEREISDSEGDASNVERQKRKHSICTHFPEHRNCDICLRTKNTRVPCRRRDGRSITRAEKFVDLITADHKVLNEGCESRNNHRYAAVVQVLATQWNGCQTKTSQETDKNLRKLAETVAEAKGFLKRTIHENLANLVKNIMESSNVYTLSIRNKRNCRTRFSTSKRGNISCIITIRIG